MTSQYPKRSWHKGNYGAISKHLASIDWDLVLYRLIADASFIYLFIYLTESALVHKKWLL